MTLIDKLLLGTLVLLLPIGLGVSYWMFPTQLSNQESDAEVAFDPAKLEAIVAETVKNNQPATPQPKQFAVNQVNFASESASLYVKGMAPAPNLSVLVTATVIKPEPSPGSKQGEDKVKGTKVETVSVIPDSAGVFEFEYELDKKQSEGVVELRFEQNDRVNTVKFDLKQRRQVL